MQYMYSELFLTVGEFDLYEEMLKLTWSNLGFIVFVIMLDHFLFRYLGCLSKYSFCVFFSCGKIAIFKAEEKTAKTILRYEKYKFSDSFTVTCMYICLSELLAFLYEFFCKLVYICIINENENY